MRPLLPILLLRLLRLLLLRVIGLLLLLLLPALVVIHRVVRSRRLRAGVRRPPLRLCSSLLISVGLRLLVSRGCLG